MLYFWNLHSLQKLTTGSSLFNIRNSFDYWLTLYLIAKGNTDSINTKRCKPPQGSILKVSAHTSSNLSTSEVYPEYTRIIPCVV